MQVAALGPKAKQLMEVEVVELVARQMERAPGEANVMFWTLVAA